MCLDKPSTRQAPWSRRRGCSFARLRVDTGIRLSRDSGLGLSLALQQPLEVSDALLNLLKLIAGQLRLGSLEVVV